MSPEKHIVWERVSAINLSHKSVSFDVTLLQSRLDKTKGLFGDNIMGCFTTFFQLRAGQAMYILTPSEFMGK